VGDLLTAAVVCLVVGRLGCCESRPNRKGCSSTATAARHFRGSIILLVWPISVSAELEAESVHYLPRFRPTADPVGLRVPIRHRPGACRLPDREGSVAAGAQCQSPRLRSVAGVLDVRARPHGGDAPGAAAWRGAVVAELVARPLRVWTVARPGFLPSQRPGTAASGCLAMGHSSAACSLPPGDVASTGRRQEAGRTWGAATVPASGQCLLVAGCARRWGRVPRPCAMQCSATTDSAAQPSTQAGMTCEVHRGCT
jgi:hypothetical protein